MISVALNWTFRLILGGALIVAGYFKLQDNSALFETVAYIYWLPNFFKSVIIDLLPWLEILLGFLLISKKLDNVALPFTAGIYLVFLLFAIYGFSTGIEGDCGCFGEAGGDGLLGSLLGSSFGWTMIIRNTLFLLMATFLLILPLKKSEGKSSF
ncbi:MAG TPA: MauE/DoxX family redox-associated membrane protein [Balneolaceae bacterium]|nr:MauE/DoxX family redox-associated membrane protein [Balneolaceae bacterium]